VAGQFEKDLLTGGSAEAQEYRISEHRGRICPFVAGIPVVPSGFDEHGILIQWIGLPRGTFLWVAGNDRLVHLLAKGH
jgi:hypothetical protein